LILLVYLRASGERGRVFAFGSPQAKHSAVSTNMPIHVTVAVVADTPSRLVLGTLPDEETVTADAFRGGRHRS
jgi:hypothetical protein